MAINSYRISCVVDAVPAHLTQLACWIASLRMAGIPDRRLMVHLVEGGSPALRHRIEALGVPVQMIARCVDGAYCNKIGGLLSARGPDPVLATDVDIAFLQQPEIPDPPADGRVWARVVDCPNPPLPILEAILRAAGFSAPLPVVPCGTSDEKTLPINCNGGFYAMSAATAAVMGPAWLRWAQWLFGRPELLPANFRPHIDQISFGLAALERDLAIEPLPADHNVPTHLGPLALTGPAKVLHYHQRQNPDGSLMLLGNPAIDRDIEDFNRRIGPELRRIRESLL